MGVHILRAAAPRVKLERVGAWLRSDGASRIIAVKLHRLRERSAMHPLTRIVLGLGIFLSLIIIGCVAMQTTKSEGLSGTIGGSRSSSFRGSRKDEFLARVTRITGIAWILTYLVLSLLWQRLEA